MIYNIYMIGIFNTFTKNFISCIRESTEIIHDPFTVKIMIWWTV